MGLFGFIKSYGKARIAGTVMRRAFGGNVLAGMAAFWLGKKLLGHYRTRRVSPGYYR